MTSALHRYIICSWWLHNWISYAALNDRCYLKNRQRQKFSSGNESGSIALRTGAKTHRGTLELSRTSQHSQTQRLIAVPNEINEYDDEQSLRIFYQFPKYDYGCAGLKGSM